MRRHAPRHDPPTPRSPATPDAPAGKRLVRYLLPSLLINGLLPVALYSLLKHDGVATVPALVAGSIFPIVNTAWSGLRTRRPDVIGLIALVFIVISAAASLVSGNTHFTLLKESVFTSLFGLIFLGSLLAPRPLSYFLARQFSTQGDAARVAAWDGNWRYPGFRRIFRVMTVIWGGMYLADALIRVGLVFVLSVPVFLVVSQVLLYGMIALTFYVSIVYGRRSWKTLATQRDAGMLAAVAVAAEQS